MNDSKAEQKLLEARELRRVSAPRGFLKRFSDHPFYTVNSFPLDSWNRSRSSGSKGRDWKQRKHRDGKEQLSAYMDKLGLTTGYLIIFDPGKKSWKEKLYYKREKAADRRIILVGV